MESSEHSIILFDGVCNFCNSSVNFIIARDPKAHFHFAPLQSETTKRLLAEHNITITEPYDSIILLDGDKLYTKSDAALAIAAKLQSPWHYMSIFRFIPKPIRESIYDLIAHNRYKLFGKKESCMMPSNEVRERFLG